MNYVQPIRDLKKLEEFKRFVQRCQRRDENDHGRRGIIDQLSADRN